MKRLLREHTALLIALILPILLIIGVLVVVYLPQVLVAEPQHRVLYREGNHNVECGYQYDVENGNLQARSVNTSRSPNEEACEEGDHQHDTFYIYDPASREHTRVAYSDVVDEMLESRHVAPDGYRINTSRYYSGGFLFFDGGSEEGWRMTKDGARHVVTFDHLKRYPRPEFVGWIIEN